MAEFTDRQRIAMAERIKEVRRHGVEMTEYTSWDSSWHGTFAEEIRPGRGNDFNGVWCDGEYLVQVVLDVYGHGFMAIADVDWKHNSEDCECEICLKDFQSETGLET